jgi:hypothetical protein
MCRIAVPALTFEFYMDSRPRLNSDQFAPVSAAICLFSLRETFIADNESAWAYKSPCVYGSRRLICWKWTAQDQTNPSLSVRTMEKRHWPFFVSLATITNCLICALWKLGSETSTNLIIRRESRWRRPCSVYQGNVGEVAFD